MATHDKIAIFVAVGLPLALAVMASALLQSTDAEMKTFLLSGGLAGYMQGIGTIAAALLAYAAFASWRTQELQKDRRDLATRVLIAAHKLERTQRLSRLYISIEAGRQDLEWVAQLLGSKQTERAVDLAGTAEDELISLQPLARQLLSDVTSTTIGDMCQLSREVQNAISDLGLIFEEELKNARHAAMSFRKPYLKLAGLKFAEDGFVEDEVLTLTNERISRLEQSLQPFLLYS